MFQIYPCCCKWHGWVVFYCMSVNTHTHTYNIFINSLVVGYLGYLHILAAVNNTSLNSGLHVLFWNNGFGFLQYILRSRTTRSCGSSRGNFILFSVVSVAICIPTNSVGRFAFLNILTNICYLCTSLFFFFFLICISLMIKDAEHFFMCCYWVFLNWYVQVKILTHMQFLLNFSHLDGGLGPFL